MISTHTIPSLQGTLAKRTKPTLRPDFAKEPFRPSLSNAGLRDSANFIDKQIDNINRQCLTHGIVHAGFSGLLAFVARKKVRCKLIGNRFVIPHDTIPSTVSGKLYRSANTKNNDMKRTISFIFILSISIFTIAQDSLSDDSLKTAILENRDSIIELNERILILNNTIDELAKKQESKEELIDFAIRQADNRVGWALGISGVIITLIIFGAGFLTYLNTVKEAREILKNFDTKVDDKFSKREQKDIINRIKVAFDYIRESENEIDENCRIISNNLPFPLSEIYRKEILNQIFFLNLDSHKFEEIYNEFSQFFFKVKDATNDKLAEYMVNYKTHIINGDAIQYYCDYHEDSLKVKKVLLPRLLESPQSIWYYWPLFLSKFDDLFKHLESENLLIKQYEKFINHILDCKDGFKKGRDYALKGVVNDIEVYKRNAQDKSSYGFIKYNEMFENHFNRIFDEAEKKVKES